MFRVRFNRGNQHLDVHLWDVHPDTFENWDAGRWAYFEKKWTNPRKGLFGELHFVQRRIRFDVIAHEVFHVICEWVWANRTSIISSNEERFAEMTDELCRKLVRGIKKEVPKLKL